jgi:hypothetical protein
MLWRAKVLRQAGVECCGWGTCSGGSGGMLRPANELRRRRTERCGRRRRCGSSARNVVACGGWRVWRRVGDATRGGWRLGWRRWDVAVVRPRSGVEIRDWLGQLIVGMTGRLSTGFGDSSRLGAGSAILEIDGALGAARARRAMPSRRRPAIEGRHRASALRLLNLAIHSTDGKPKRAA